MVYPHRTPLQLWHTGVIYNPQILEDGPLPELQTNNVIIPDISESFHETTMNAICQVNPLENDGNHAIGLFSSLVAILQRT